MGETTVDRVSIEEEVTTSDVLLENSTLLADGWGFPLLLSKEIVKRHNRQVDKFAVNYTLFTTIDHAINQAHPYMDIATTCLIY